MKKIVILVFTVLLALSYVSSFVAMSEGPKKLQEHISKAEDYEEREVYIEAVSEYKEALKLKPKRVDLIMRIADDYMLMGDTQNYVSSLKDAVNAQGEGSSEALDILMNYYKDTETQSSGVSFIKSYCQSHPDDEKAKEWLIEFKGAYTELYCRYDTMEGFEYGSMLAKNDGMYFILDENGNTLSDQSYSEITPFLKGAYARTISEKGRVIFIDEKGFTRISPGDDFSDIGVLFESKISASKGGKYGFLDENGEEAMEFSWDGITAFNKAALAKSGNKWGVIDSSGKEKSEFVYDDVIVDRYNIAFNQSRAFVKKNGKYAMINTKGEEVMEPQFDDALIFNPDGFAAVCKNGKWGFVNAEGEMVIDCTYEKALSFSYGYAAVYKDGLWGYIDTDGNMIMEPKFLEATSFAKNGTVAVKIKGTEGREDQWKLIHLVYEI